MVIVPYLARQLTEAYKQYAQLLQLVRSGQASLDYLRWINSGLDDITGIIETLPIKDERILADIRSLQRGVRKIDELYGIVPKSGEAPMQTLHDQTVAESFEMTTGVRDYSLNQEANAKEAFELSQKMSPRGAVRLSAALDAQILLTMTQLLKVNSQLLKLQSEQFAMANMESKVSVGHFNKMNADVGKGLEGFKPEPSLPRF